MSYSSENGNQATVRPKSELNVEKKSCGPQTESAKPRALACHPPSWEFCQIDCSLRETGFFLWGKLVIEMAFLPKKSNYNTYEQNLKNIF